MFSSQRKPMIKAAAEGDLKALTQLIKQKCTLDDKNEALLSAARHGQLPVVERLFRHGVLLDYRDADGKSALAHAVMNGHMDVFYFLVDRKQAELDILDCESRTLLMLAARHAQTDLVRELIDRGCNVFETDANDQTAFLHAATGPDDRGPATMAMLLEKAPKLINLADDHKITPLMHAAKTNKQNILNFLLDHEADLSPKDNVGFTALEHATQYGNLDAFNQLFQKTKQPLNLTRLLILAIKNDHINIITRLIELGADINKPNANGNTPIMLAARYATPKTFKFLLGYEPDVTAKNNQGETALCWAQNENANLLLRHRGKTQVTRDDIDACRVSAEYPTRSIVFHQYIEEKNRQLHQAVEQNNVAEAASLIEQGAYPNFVIDTAQTTLLHLAVEKGDSHLDMATLLIKAGTYINNQNAYHTTPLTSAIKRGHAAMVSHLLQQGAPLPSNALYVAAQQANPAVMDALRQAGAHLNGLDLQFRTPLMHAAFHGNTATVKWLLAHEVNVRTKTPNGDTALSLATKNDEKDVVEALLQQSGRTKVTASDIINAHNIAKRSAHSRCLALFELYKEKAQQLDHAIEQGNITEILAIPHDSQAPNAALLATLETWLNNKTPGDFEIESVMMNHLLTPLNATETDHLRKILTQLNTNEPKKLTQLRHTLLTWIKKITHPKKAIASEATTHLQENYTAYKDSSQKDPQKPALFEILRVHESKGVNQSTGTWRDFIAIMKRQCEDEPRIPSVSTASLFAQNMPDGQELQFMIRPPTTPLNQSQ